MRRSGSKALRGFAIRINATRRLWSKEGRNVEWMRRRRRRSRWPGNKNFSRAGCRIRWLHGRPRFKIRIRSSDWSGIFAVYGGRDGRGAKSGPTLSHRSIRFARLPDAKQREREDPAGAETAKILFFFFPVCVKTVGLKLMSCGCDVADSLLFWREDAAAAAAAAAAESSRYGDGRRWCAAVALHIHDAGTEREKEEQQRCYYHSSPASLSHSFFFFFSSSSSSLFIFFSFFLLTTPDDRYLISVSKSRGASFPSQVDARTFPKLFRLHHQSQRVARPGITRFRLNRLPCCVCIYISISIFIPSKKKKKVAVMNRWRKPSHPCYVLEGGWWMYNSQMSRLLLFFLCCPIEEEMEWWIVRPAIRNKNEEIFWAVCCTRWGMMHSYRAADNKRKLKEEAQPAGNLFHISCCWQNKLSRLFPTGKRSAPLLNEKFVRLYKTGGQAAAVCLQWGGRWSCATSASRANSSGNTQSDWE